MTFGESPDLTQVLFLGGARYSHPLDGSIKRKFCELSRQVNLFVVAFSTRPRFEFFHEHAHFYLLPRIPIALGRYVQLTMLGALLSLWCILRHKVGVVVAQSPYEGVPAIAAKRLARLTGRRVVVIIESHGDFERALSFQRRLRARALYRMVMRRSASFSIRRADLFRCISDATCRQLREWGAPRDFHKFPAWTDLDLFLRVGDNRDAGGSKDVLFAGSLVRGKGVHDLIEAFGQIAAKYPKDDLLIVGDSSDNAYRDKLQSQAVALGVLERVLFKGRVTQEELAELMRRAAVLVLPTYSEGLSRVVMEAMCVGLPVVATDVGGVPELIDDRNTGLLIQSGNTSQLKDGLGWALERREEAREMGRRARAYALTHFSIESYIQGYSCLLQAASRLTQVQDRDAGPTF